MIPAHELRRLQAVARDSAHLDTLVALRLGGEPLQYLEGSAAFGPVNLTVDSRVLIPRPETEGLWDLAVQRAVDPQVIVDLCTGSGALAIALQRSFPAARVVGTDVSEAALEVARLNGSRLAPGVEWRQGDLWRALPADLRGQVDLLVSNPPYVAAGEWDDLPTDVRAEPRAALVAGPTGLELLERIAADAAKWLAPAGNVLCEIGETQGDAVRRMFAGYRSTDVLADLTGRDRYVVAGV